MALLYNMDGLSFIRLGNPYSERMIHLIRSSHHKVAYVSVCFRFFKNPPGTLKLAHSYEWCVIVFSAKLNCHRPMMYNLIYFFNKLNRNLNVSTGCYPSILILPKISDTKKYDIIMWLGYETKCANTYLIFVYSTCCISFVLVKLFHHIHSYMAVDRLL